MTESRESTQVPPPLPEGERASAIDVTRTLERRMPPLFCLFFYGFPALGAWALLYNTLPGHSTKLWTVQDPVFTFSVAAGLVILLLAIRGVSLQLLPAARALESEFGWMIGCQKKWECIWIAILSGVAEEYMFRGWLQAETGLWIAAAIFGVLHWPVNRNFYLWPIFAFVAGVGFGAVTIWTGSLYAAVIAHAAYNAVSLWRISDRFRDWNQPRVDAYVKTGAWA